MGELYGLACPFYRPDAPGTEYELPTGQWEQYGAEPLYERFAPTAFDRVLRLRRNVRCDLLHNGEIRIGYTEDGVVRLWVDEVGLWYAADLSRCTGAHQLRELIASRSLRGASVRFIPREYRVFTEGGRRILEHTEVHLEAFSPVSSPAYTATTVGVRGGHPFEPIEGEQL
ncbi:HK97 family phage prohead protease [Gemmata sp. G18]|uniref:HK97 family phage prohead protease n=1 Tax=Gemmata palustris TaxID=2822762 RepID=A0ABS5BJZ3_9BACT|nr:HK97 family phage prohead protease [Gemmata palustris]MBP3954014.1 HK97 family phage prohead protease [Gemmata palustris]